MADNSEKFKSSEIVTVFDRFLRDGVVKKKYQKWNSGLFVIVPTNSWIIFRKRFDKNRMWMSESGTLVVNPLFTEYIFVPKNSTTIDYSTETNNFKFQTDVDNDGYEVEVDPVVTVRISDPITYICSSNNALADLKDLISSILKNFVAVHTANDLSKKSFSLAQIDLEDQLSEFEENYGLKVENLKLKNVKLPEEINQAKVAKEKAKYRVKEAEQDKQTAALKAEAEMEYNTKFVESIQMARELGMSEGMIAKMIDHYSVRSAPSGSHIIVGNSGNMNGYVPTWMLGEMKENSNFADSNAVTLDEDGNLVDDGGYSMVRRRR